MEKMREKRKTEQIVLEERSKKLKVKLALFFSLFKIGLFSISANKITLYFVSQLCIFQTFFYSKQG